MIYLLLATLIVILIVDYYLGGKDLFAPSTIQIITFAGSVFMCIYFMWSMDCAHKFHWDSIGMIMSAMFLSMILGIVAHWMLTRVRIPAHTPDSVRISPISTGASFVFLGVNLITIAWLLSEIRRIGGDYGSFAATMNRFHALNSYSIEEEGRLPWLLNQLISLTHVIFLLFCFNLIRFFKELTAWNKWNSFIIVALCVLTLLLTGARTPVVNDLIACFIMFHLLRIQKQGGFRPYRLKFLLRIVAVLLLVLVAFFLVKSFVGRDSRNETMNMADYISYYIGSGYIAFDKYLQDPPEPSNIFGKETFTNLILSMIRHGIINIPPYIVHLEFRQVGGGFTNNVYTFLRFYHYDFGIIGTFFLHGISISFLSAFYEYVKRKRGNIGILIFSMMYYSVAMSFFTERFFSSIISLNFLKMSVMIVLLYELTIRKRIRFTIHRRQNGSQLI